MMNFTGSTRRQRQVNLSGKPKSGTATSSSRASHGSNTAAVARELRLQRETERIKHRSATKIQSVYRGHRTRKACKQRYRDEYDALLVALRASQQTRNPTTKELEPLLSRLVAFWQDHNWADRERLLLFLDVWAVARKRVPAQSFGQDAVENHIRLRYLLGKLSVILLTTLGSLSRTSTMTANKTLCVESLAYLVQNHPYVVTDTFYKDLTITLHSTEADDLAHLSHDPAVALSFKRIFLMPLFEVSATNHDRICNSFALDFLTVDNSLENLERILSDKTFAVYIPLQALCQHLLRADLIALSTTQLSWLTAHLIYIHHAQSNAKSKAVYTNGEFLVTTDYEAGDKNVLVFTQCLTLLLQLTLSDNAMTDQPPKTKSDEHILPPKSIKRRHSSGSALRMPEFIQTQFSLLTSHDFISGFLSEITQTKTTQNIDQSPNRSNKQIAVILAQFAFVLLLAFPESRQNTRMWLYVGHTAAGESLLDYFWSFTKSLSIVVKSKRDLAFISKALSAKPHSGPQKEGNQDASQEWALLFIFLELLSFAMVVLDDQDFFSGKGFALTLAEIQDFSIFLKNLGFVTFWNVKDIEQSTGDNDTRMLEASGQGSSLSSDGRQDIAGINGVTLSWLRSITVRLLRMIYGRDSRQRFLPRHHWLMTNEVGMDGFIPAVVAEDEARRQSNEAKEISDSLDEDDTESESEDDLPTAMRRYPMMVRSQRTSRFHSTSKEIQKLSKLNHLAAITPRLEILRNLPFFIPFKTRVEIFREFVVADQLLRRNGHLDPDIWRMSLAREQLLQMNNRDIIGRHHGRISRDSVFEDAYDEFYGLGDGLKEPIQITFVDSFGAEEAGIDGGGVTKEFLTSVVKESFKPEDRDIKEGEYKLFAETEEHLLYPSPTVLEELKSTHDAKMKALGTRTDTWAKPITKEEARTEMLRRFEFLGRIIGKCMYEGILVDVAFARFFLFKWSRSPASSDDAELGEDDLKDLDKDLWKGLQALKHYDSETIDGLCLTFSTQMSLDISGKADHGPKVVTIDLKPNGSLIPVTISNRLEYIHLLAKHHLVLQSRAQTNAFVEGLSLMISPRWLNMFNQPELQTLVGGNDSPINITDWRRNTIYGGVYTIGDDGLEHPTVVIFWTLLEKLANEDRQKVLKFVTSVSRAPLLGFSALKPQFCIRDAGGDVDRLPSTSTCVNLLKLPRYSSEEIMAEKLLYAVRSGAGFDLS